MSYNQKEGVYQVIKSVLASHNLTHEDGTSVAEAIQPHRREVVALTAKALIDTNIQMKPASYAKYGTDALMMKYADGLVNNWIRKDTRLNGGEKYITKNPGARTGSSDPQLKALKVAKAAAQSQAAIDLIDAKITERTAQLKTPRVKAELTPETLASLPADVQAFFNAPEPVVVFDDDFEPATAEFEGDEGDEV